MRRRLGAHLDRTGSRTAIGSEALTPELWKGKRGIAGWGAGLERVRRLAALAFAVPQDAVDNARIRNDGDNLHPCPTATQQGVNLENLPQEPGPCPAYCSEIWLSGICLQHKGLYLGF